MAIPYLLQPWGHFEVAERQVLVQTKACWIDPDEDLFNEARWF